MKQRRKTVYALIMAASLLSGTAWGQVRGDLADIAKILKTSTATQQARDESARRLIARSSSDANDVLKDVLVDVKDRSGQLAVARALAWQAPAADEFMVPLVALLGDDRGLTEAAATALARSDQTPRVLPLFVAFIDEPRYPEASRIAVIRSMAVMPEKAVAAALMNIISSRQQTPALRVAATDELAELTGIDSNGQDVVRWSTWWDLQKNVSDTDFRRGILARRTARLEQMQQQRDVLNDEIQSLLVEAYQMLPEAQKPDRLLRFLNDSQPELRAVGARIIYNDAVENRTIAPEARAKLRELIADSSRIVRMQVASALQQINDASAAGELLDQLQHETQADVRSAIAAALGNMQDIKSVPMLMSLLDDPAYRVEESAAQALQAIGPALKDKDPAAAKKLGDQLRQLVDARVDSIIADHVRPVFASAMVPLKDPDLLPTFYRLSMNNESLQVRRAAIAGVGELAREDTADRLIELSRDPASVIRLDALSALGHLKTSKYADVFLKELDEKNEPEEVNRTKAWEILSTVIVPVATSDQLAQWADRFADQPERQLIVLTQLEKNRASENDPAALARVRQTLGQLLLHQLSRPADAVNYLKQAIAYLRSRPSPDAKTMQTLVSDCVDAMLQSRQYTDAATFASQVLAESPDNQQLIAPRIWQEVERLRQSGDLAAAQALIDEAIKINPPLASRYRMMLQNVSNELRARRNS